MNKRKQIVIPEEVVMNKIYKIRGKKVMVDSDLATLYQVETKQLKRQVRRNKERFPEDFMFELTITEYKNLRSHIGTSSEMNWGGTRYAPMAFTEQGVAMLSSVLNSKIAIDVNIQIIRVFTKMREMLLTQKGLLLEMEEIKKKVSGHDEKIELIFNYLKQFITEKDTPRKKIGFKIRGGV